MILISAGLVVTAIVLLIVGVVLAKPFLVMWSIAVSVLSAVFLVIGALLRRHELFPGGGNAGAAVPPLPPKGQAPAGPMPVPPMTSHQRVPSAPHPVAPHGAQRTATAAAPPRTAPAAGPVPAARRGVLDADAIVLVIPGRRRYHIAGCRQLVGREHEELTHEEAREEGFTPCTTCLPEFTGGIQPQDASPEAQEPAAPLASQESGPSGDAGESDVHEPTVRLDSPYASSPAEQEDQVTRPSVQRPPAAQGETRPQERRPSPPLRAAGSAAQSSPARPPVPEGETSSDSESTGDSAAATSWFSRDVVRSAASESESPAEPAPAEREPAAVKREAAAEAETPVKADAASAEPEAATSGSPAEAAAGPEVTVEASVEPEVTVEASAEPEEAASGSQAETVATGSEAEVPAEPEPAEPAGDASEDEPLPVKRQAPATPVPADAPKPVEPAETGPGRAGQPVSADSTLVEASTAEEAAEEAEEKTPGGAPEESPAEDREDDDTAPGGIPIIEIIDEEEEPPSDDSGMVKVIVGTRRFHSSACPLIRGTDDNGIETMSRAEAEKAGLSSCSVCQKDR
ncbi:hypothetical protein [Streptosporangium sp. NPDC000396]|uniref:hypothetical protein n=1 Tax=Streptosporangium sp. NPDC000396 TaxID=3366185 RepID=UPI00368A908E